MQGWQSLAPLLARGVTGGGQEELGMVANTRPDLHGIKGDESCTGEVTEKPQQREEKARMKGEEFELLRALRLQCPTSPDVQAPT